MPASRSLRPLRPLRSPRPDAKPGRGRRRRLIAALAAASALLSGSGCIVAGLAGAMGQSFESQKLIEVAPLYAGLEGKRVAVVVNAGLDIRWSDPGLGTDVCNFVSRAIAANVPDVQVASPASVIVWQNATPQWDAMPLGEIAIALDVDRVVFVDVYEYRLNPPGNRYLWDGVCAATVGIIERDGFDTDSFVETFEVSATFPDVEGVGREQVAGAQIATGLKSKFITRVAWLFYKHEEPKYPDLYRPEMDR